MNGIHFIITGGTIDSEYFPPHETAEPNKTTIIPDFIDLKIRPYFEKKYDVACMLDSGGITDEIRSKIAELIQESDFEKFVITHGTNTMTETADYLQKSTEGSKKTIILTGSMIPLKEFAMSDAGFNLGYAVAAAQHCDSGVYICMHGQTFEAGKVKKNFDDARFEALKN